MRCVRKNKIDVETYRFIGDFVKNKATKLESVNGIRKVTGNYTQMSVINGLKDVKKYIVGGRKVNTGLDDRVTYQIDLGKDNEHISQIIQVVIDKDVVDKRDPNALAVESLCNHSIKVKHRNIRNDIACTFAMAGAFTAIIGGIMYADAKESEYTHNNDLTKPDSIVEYQEENPYKEIDNKFDYSDSGIQDISSDEYTSGRSY